MIFAITVTAIIAYMILSDIFEKRDQHRNAMLPPSGHPTNGYGQNTNWVAYPDQQGPVFSPTRRYVWDGEKWVLNETYFGAGFFLGLVLGLALLALYLFY